MRVTFPDPKQDEIYAVQNKANALLRSESSADCRLAIKLYTKILSMLTLGSSQWMDRSLFIGDRARAYRKVGDYKKALSDLHECLNIESERGNTYTMGVIQKQIDEITKELKDARKQGKWWEFWR